MLLLTGLLGLPMRPGTTCCAHPFQPPHPHLPPTFHGCQQRYQPNHRDQDHAWRDTVQVIKQSIEYASSSLRLWLASKRWERHLTLESSNLLS